MAAETGLNGRRNTTVGRVLGISAPIVLGILLLTGAPFWLRWVHLQIDRTPLMRPHLPVADPLPVNQFVIPIGPSKHEDLYEIDARSEKVVRAVTQDAAGTGAPTMTGDRRTIFYADQGGAVHAVATNGKDDRILFNQSKDCPFVRRVSVARTDPNHLLLQCRPRQVGSQSDMRDYFEIVDLRGVAVREIRPLSLSTDDPTLSPDGKSIAYWGSDAPPDSADGGSLYVISADGREGAKELLRGAVGEDADPAWSPNGKQIAFRTRLSGHKAVERLTLKTRAVSRVLAGSSDYEKPSWSPDGKSLVLVSRSPSGPAEGRYSLTIVDIATHKRIDLPMNYQSIFAPAWAGR